MISQIDPEQRAQRPRGAALRCRAAGRNLARLCATESRLLHRSCRFAQGTEATNNRNSRGEQSRRSRDERSAVSTRLASEFRQRRTEAKCRPERDSAAARRRERFPSVQLRCFRTKSPRASDRRSEHRFCSKIGQFLLRMDCRRVCGCVSTKMCRGQKAITR